MADYEVTVYYKDGTEKVIPINLAGSIKATIRTYEGEPDVKNVKQTKALQSRPRKK